jgi:hypothetical protein
VVAVASSDDPVFITDVELPSSVSPNSRIPISFTIRNDKGSSVPFVEPDNCTSSQLGQGIRINATLTVDGTEQSTEQRCVTIDGGERSVTFSPFAAADPGEMRIEIAIAGANSDNVFSRFEQTVTVEADAPTGDCPDGFRRQDGVCVPVDDGGGGDGGDETPLDGLLPGGPPSPRVVLAIIALFGLAWLASSGSDIADAAGGSA